MRQFKHFLLFFLFVLTLGCGQTNQNSTTTVNTNTDVKDTTDVEVGSQQTDDNNNADESEEDQVDMQENEPVTQTVSSTINDNDSQAYFPGFLSTMSYEAYEFDGLEGQTFEITIETYNEDIAAGGIFLYKTDDFNYAADSYKEATEYIESNLGLGGSLKALLSESTSYTLFVAVSMEHVKEDGMDEVDYTLTWTLKDYEEPSSQEGAQTVTDTLTSSDLSGSCSRGQTTQTIYYDVYTINANEGEIINFYLEASNPDGAEISGVALAFYDPEEFDSDQMYVCYDINYQDLGAGAWDDIKPDLSVEVPSSGNYWIVVEDFGAYKSFELINYTLTWTIEIDK